MKLALHALKDRLPRSTQTHEPRQHVDAAARWLANAQDATADGGVSAFYDLKRTTWAASYPETTGYMIPTFFDYAAFAKAPEFAQRARRMADWEADIQLSSGAVRAGTVDRSNAEPTIFNTGQVLFGWTRAWIETQDSRFREAALRAAEWLVAAQDDDGAWRRYGSPVTTYHLNSYNTRTAYGLARAGSVFAQQHFVDAASANVDWAISNAHSNTWLDDNDLQDNQNPLTHTIAYALRGILEVGVIANNSQYIEFATRMARAVASAQREDGALPGRLNSNWQSKMRWSCLTGNAQMAINWLRLAHVVEDNSFRQHAQRANRFNMTTQMLTGAPEMAGAIKGSHPINGGYMTWRYPNWAAKFFMDALMLEDGVDID